MKKSPRVAVYFLFGSPLLCCLGGGLALFLGTKSAHTGVSLEREEARKLGMPLSFSDLSIPRVPDALNAAPLYLQAAKLLAGSLKSEQEKADPGWFQSATPADRTDAKHALIALAPVLELMRALPTRRECDFHRDWSLGLKLRLPELGAMEACARDLCLKAEAQDDQGNWKEAIQSLALAHRISHDCGLEPLLIATLDQTSIRLGIDRECEGLIGRHTRNQAILDALDRVVRSHGDMPNLRKVMGGEFVLGSIEILTLQTLRTSPGPDDSVIPTSPEKQFFGSPLVQDSLQANYISKWSIGWKQFPRDDRDWAGFGVALRAMGKAVDEDEAPANYLSQMLIPTGGFFTDSVGTLQARDRLLLTSIALLKAKLETGKLPVALPSSLGDTRLDPFDGAPLRYRRSGAGFVLYSIGRDRTDDGGRCRPPRTAPGTHYDEVVEFQ